ncbi:hypothetical protein [Amycolatopsis cihanbeyliensis]|uniref:Tetratricopeptide repeat protein n=1 Tax=Amycolatopsis cihanbeyliensis TaxID=1128664 RepID=A0A542DPQ2_AMYCI|nr:hypothetical protein [Amycolatopsis cihanbeyliensis]TQJ05072.1 hypothetical protein FB471_4895 [Amycolatopsis cihanbeyliensis]
MSDALFNALAAAHHSGDDLTFTRLCEENAQWIAANWVTWSRVPPELREQMKADPAQLQRSGQLVFRIAAELDLIGYRQPMDHMRGATGPSPVVRFENTVHEARQRAENGEHEECRSLLLDAIGELEGNAGAEAILAQGHVELAMADARLGDLPSAIDHLHTARDLEQRAGHVYHLTSASLLDAFTVALRRDPETIAVRDTIAHAQMLSDIGQFAESNAELARLARSDHYLGKVYGLTGLNHFRLGDLAAAHDYTSRAVAECERAGDRAGVTIYTTNLRAIERTS